VPNPPPSEAASHTAHNRRNPSLDGLLSGNGGTHLSRRTLANPPYPCGIWRWRNPTTGETTPFRCGRWDCPTCSPKTAERWAAIITAAEPERHLVLTNLGTRPEPARARLRNFVKAIRRGQAHGAGARANKVPFEYFAAFETNSSSPNIHAHLLQHGTSIPQRALSDLLPRYHAGHICWIKSLSSSRRPRAVAVYVARHLVGHVHADQAKKGRRVRYSRGFWRGKTAAEIRAELFPPAPEPWELVKPDVLSRQAQKILNSEERQLRYEDWALAHLTERQLLRLGYIRDLTPEEELT